MFEDCSRKEITDILSLSLSKHINPYNDARIYFAKEVTFDYSSSHTIRVDFMRFVPKNNSVSGIEKGDCYCYEIKSSVEDFQSKNGHNFIGDYNYYVMPEKVYATVYHDIPYGIGVLVPDLKSHFGGWYDLKSIKKAKRRNRERPVSEVLLMMFRSANRDLIKGKV